VVAGERDALRVVCREPQLELVDQVPAVPRVTAVKSAATPPAGVLGAAAVDVLKLALEPAEAVLPLAV
jgi:hypothetical protein